MTVDKTKYTTMPFGSLTTPIDSIGPAVGGGSLASVDFTKLHVSDILPMAISGQTTNEQVASGQWSSWFSVPKLSMPDFSNVNFMPMNFSMPPINLTPPAFNFGTSYTDNFTRTTTPSSYLSYSNSQSGKIKIDGYNAEKGLKLSRIADKHLNDPEVKNGVRRCAQTVRENLQAAGLFNGMQGHGYQYVDILRKNSNFKEIPVENNNWQHLPAGCIVVYGKGVGGHNKTFGDVGIITEDGQQTSFYKTKSVSEIKKPTAIFVPV